MIDKIKRIFLDGGIYGIAQLAGKLINFLLIPFLSFTMQRSQFGVYTDLFTWVAFLMIVLTFGTETALFRFSQTDESVSTEDKAIHTNKVFMTSSLSVFGVSLAIASIVYLFLPEINHSLRYDDTPEIVLIVLGILLLDTWSALPKAWLRLQEKKFYFIATSLGNIVTNLLCAIFFLVILPKGIENNWSWVSPFSWMYKENWVVQYVFVSNLLASLLSFVLLFPVYLRQKWVFDPDTFKQIASFGVPLMLAGLAGMFNERADIQMLKYLLPSDIALDQIGMYGIVYKFGATITILNQIFRIAAEPLVFKHFKSSNKEDKLGLALTTDWFVIVLSTALVCTMASRFFIELLIDAKFESSLRMLPLLLLANVFYAVSIQLSFWYKIAQKTSFGLLITLIGAIVTLVGTYFFIPTYGYDAAAWATLFSYTTMMVVSYVLGQKYNPYPYDIFRNILFISLAMLLGSVAWSIPNWFLLGQIACVLSYFAIMYLLLIKDIRIIRSTPAAQLPNFEHRWNTKGRKILVLVLFAASIVSVSWISKPKTMSEHQAEITNISE